MADTRPHLRSQRMPLDSHECDSGLTANLQELFARSGLHECVQFYGRHFYGFTDGMAEGLVTEELLVYALLESERKRRENQENVLRLTIALAEAEEAFRAATARAERANIIVEALAESARIHGDVEEKPSKRGRHE
jgi:hypothetical protein